MPSAEMTNIHRHDHPYASKIGMKKTQRPAPTLLARPPKLWPRARRAIGEFLGEHHDASGARGADDCVEPDLKRGEPNQTGRDGGADAANRNRGHAPQDHAAAAVAIDHPGKRERAQRRQRDPCEQAGDACAVEMKAGADPRRGDRDDRDGEALVKEHREQRDDGRALAAGGVGG